MYNIYIYIDLFLFDDIIDLDVCFYIFDIYIYIFIYIHIWNILKPFHLCIPSLFLWVFNILISQIQKTGGGGSFKIKIDFLFCWGQTPPYSIDQVFFSQDHGPGKFLTQNAVVFFTCFGEGFGAFRHVQRWTRHGPLQRHWTILLDATDVKMCDGCPGAVGAATLFQQQFVCCWCFRVTKVHEKSLEFSMGVLPIENLKSFATNNWRGLWWKTVTFPPKKVSRDTNRDENRSQSWKPWSIVHLMF